MEKIIFYSVGLVCMSACVDNTVTTEELEKAANNEHPTGVRSTWKLSKDKFFRQGQPNPCPCEERPETRKHYLLNC